MGASSSQSLISSVDLGSRSISPDEIDSLAKMISLDFLKSVVTDNKDGSSLTDFEIEGIPADTLAKLLLQQTLFLSSNEDDENDNSTDDAKDKRDDASAVLKSIQLSSNFHKGRIYSRLLSFLDLFESFSDDNSVDEKEGKDQQPTIAIEYSKTNARAEIHIDTLNRFQNSFLYEALIALQLSSLIVLNARIVSDPEARLVYLLPYKLSLNTDTRDENQSTKALTNKDVCVLIEQIEDDMDVKGQFPCQVALEMCLQKCVEYLAKHLNEYLPTDLEEDLKDVKVSPISCSGMDFMIQYEVGFMADYANKVVAFPLLDQLTDGHVDFMMENYQRGRKSRGRVHRDVYFWCFDRASHEVIHLVQGAAKQTDSNVFSWSAEFDASVPAYSLLHAIATNLTGNEEKNIMADFFEHGFVYEVLAKTTKDDADLMGTWKQEERKEYLSWRNAFGLQAPNIEPDQNVLDSSFCGAASCEYYSEKTEDLNTILSLLFKERTGDVYAKKLENPSHLCVGMDSLLAPLSALKDDVQSAKANDILSSFASAQCFNVCESIAKLSSKLKQ